MQVAVHPSIPATDVGATTDDLPSYVALLGDDGVLAQVRGTGTATLYVLLDGAWRAHPQQNGGITDDGEFARLVIGRGSQYKVCMVGDAEAAYLQAVRF